MQAIEPLDMLLAFKAISLASGLKESDRRVGSALLDHFNRETGQCDPSLETIAYLLGISRRTCIRCINSLVKVGFFRRIRHGGNFHRNLYQPAWKRFSEVNAAWMARRKEYSRRFERAALSPCEGQERHLAGDTADTQTCLINQHHETLLHEPLTKRTASHEAKASKRLTEKARGKPSQMRAVDGVRVKRIASRDAAYDAAERRWNRAINDRYRSHPEVYARVIEAIDADLQSEATKAEQRSPGAGAHFIIGHLRKRSIGLGE